MASYELRIKRSAAKELDAIPAKDLRRITAQIQALGTTPRPPRSQKLSGAERYRIRQGDFRILYEIDDARQVVVVVKIGQRGDVFR